MCLNCGWIYFADPKVAAAVLVEKDSLVLLVQRNNHPFQGLWTLPAGFVDAGEDPAHAAERECLEETGLTVRITSLMEIISGLEHARGANMVIVYRGQVESGTLQASDDASRVDWFSLDDLPPLAFEATKQVLSKLQNKT